MTSWGAKARLAADSEEGLEEDGLVEEDVVVM